MNQNREAADYGSAAGPAKGRCRGFVLAAGLLAAALLALAPSPTAAAGNAKFNYQGNLRQAGFLVNGSRPMKFRLYLSSSALLADAIWTSAEQNVGISTGVFKVTLEPPLSVWDNDTLWLELEVAGTRLAPREELTAAPMSVRALTASTATVAVLANNTILFNGKKYPTQASAPNPPASGHVLGDLWMDSSIMSLKFWNGTEWVTVTGSGLPGAHAPTHAQGGADPITSLGAHTVTGDVTMAVGSSIMAAAAAQYVNVGSNLNVAGSLNGFSDLTIGGADYKVTFGSMVVLGDNNLKYGTGAAGQVLKSLGDGYVTWGTDTNGGFEGTPYRIQMTSASGTAFADSLFLQSADGTGITLVDASSLTVTGSMGAAGNLEVGGSAAVTGALNVLSSATITQNLLVLGSSQLGDDAVNDLHSVNRSTEAGVAFSVDSAGTSGSYAAKFYSGGTLAAWIKKK